MSPEVATASALPSAKVMVSFSPAAIACTLFTNAPSLSLISAKPRARTD